MGRRGIRSWRFDDVLKRVENPCKPSGWQSLFEDVGFNDLGHPGSQKTPAMAGDYGTYNLPVNVTLVEVFGRSHDGGRDDNGQRRADGCFDGDAHEVGQCGYDNDAPADFGACP